MLKIKSKELAGLVASSLMLEALQIFLGGGRSPNFPTAPSAVTRVPDKHRLTIFVQNLFLPIREQSL